MTRLPGLACSPSHSLRGAVGWSSMSLSRLLPWQLNTFCHLPLAKQRNHRDRQEGSVEDANLSPSSQFRVLPERLGLDRRPSEVTAT